MSTLNDTTFDSSLLFDDGTRYFYFIQFWVFIALIIPSMISSFFVLYHLLGNRNLRAALYNHMIIIILMINLFYQMTDMILFIDYFRSYESFTRAVPFRLVWGYIDFTFYFLQCALFAWTTIERHILIFHERLVSTWRKRLIVHYLPPVIITVYALVYYLVTFFGVSCENNFDYIAVPGAIPCSLGNPAQLTYEIVAHTILPTFVIVLSSIALLLRSVWQKYRVRRQVDWRQYRKMIIQVLAISSIYLIFLFPYICMIFLLLCGVDLSGAANYMSYAMFSTYYTLFLFPIVTVGSLPELRRKLTNILRFRRQHVLVAPINPTVLPSRGLPTVAQ